MGRLGRGEQQRRTRDLVLAAARAEFTEKGYRDAKIEEIAERAELTRGAVYSNFPGKRALYFAVLIDLAEKVVTPPIEPGRTAAEALGAFARAWTGRLPLAIDGGGSAEELRAGLLGEVVADERLRAVFGQAQKLSALLLGLAVEEMAAPGELAGRKVRAAETVLTVLHGAAQLAVAAPGFGDPFDLALVCGRLAADGPEDGWDPPHLPYVPDARKADDAWATPAGLDVVSGEPERIDRSGVVAVLGLGRLEAAEEAVRAARPGDVVTVAVVTADPDERGRLARFCLVDLMGCLWEAFPPRARPRLRVMFDDRGAIAAAAGVQAGDLTEAAVRIRDGRVVARAEGRGALHAAASFKEQ